MLIDDDSLRNRLNGLMDILYAFLLKCLDRLEENGELIFITPTFWTETLHASTIRKEMNENGYLDTVILLDEAKVFNNVSSTIMIFKFVKNKNKKEMNVVKIPKTKKIDKEVLENITSCLSKINAKKQEINEISFFKQNAFTTNDSWKFNPSHIIKKIESIKTICKKFIPDVGVELHEKILKIPITDLLKNEDLKELKIDKVQCFKVQYNKKWYFVKKINVQKTKHLPLRYVRLDDIADIGNGMVSGLDKAFQANPSTKFLQNEKNMFIKVVKSHSLEKFVTVGETQYIFVNNIENEKNLKKLKNIHNQLLQYKTELEKRYDYGRKINWWEWVFLRNKKLLEDNDEKILVPCKERINKKRFVRFSYCKGNYYATQDVTTIVKKPQIKENIKYILAILNSKIIFFWIEHQGLSRGGVAEFSERPLSKIPIRLIDWNDPTEVKIHTNIVRLVDQILETGNSEKISAKIEKEIVTLYEI